MTRLFQLKVGLRTRRHHKKPHNFTCHTCCCEILIETTEYLLVFSHLYTAVGNNMFQVNNPILVSNDVSLLAY